MAVKENIMESKANISVERIKLEQEVKISCLHMAQRVTDSRSVPATSATEVLDIAKQFYEWVSL